MGHRPSYGRYQRENHAPRHWNGYSNRANGPGPGSVELRWRCDKLRPPSSEVLCELSRSSILDHQSNVEPRMVTRHLKSRMMGNSLRYLRVLLIAFFVCSSFTSPDRFTLCTGEDGGACTEPLGAAYGSCLTEAGHRCDSTKGCDMGTAHHHHRPCTDPPFTANLQHISDHERLSRPQCLSFPSSSAGVADAYAAHRVDRTVSRETALARFHLSSLQDLRSVVLLI